MADRYPAEIQIGGDFPRSKLSDFFNSIEGYSEWDEGPSPENEKELLRCVSGDCLELTNHEARNGEFEDMESWLCENDIPFDRFSGSYGEYSAEMAWYRPGMDRPEVALMGNSGGFVIDQSGVENVLKILVNTWTAHVKVSHAVELLEKLIVKVPSLPKFRIVD